MTTNLPPNLLRLFIPRPPLDYLPQTDLPPGKRLAAKVDGVAQFLQLCKDHDLDYKPTETHAEKKERQRLERIDRRDKAVKKALDKWDPSTDKNTTSDPYKTLFVTSLNKETSERTIKKFFEEYGTIKSLRLITNPVTKRSRGYAFIEYKREADMKAAYKDADGLKINGKRVMVDCERGRTVNGWKPKRLGGGKAAKQPVQVDRRDERRRDDRKRDSRVSVSSSYGGDRRRDTSTHSRERRRSRSPYSSSKRR